MQQERNSLAALPTLEEIRAAAEVVYQAMRPTAQYTWPLLNQRAGNEVWIKHENHTASGAFKIRGGLVYFDWLRREHAAVATVISATRGNHGQSLALAAKRYGIRVVIVVPYGNSIEKNQAMVAQGAQLIEHGQDFQDASEYAERLAEENGWHRVPSYHPLLVRGVASYALELFSAVEDIDTLYVPIGLGSGISGVIAIRDALRLKTHVIGVVSTHATAYALSFAAKRVVAHAVTPTIADGVSCRLPDAGALEIILRGVDDIVLVEDDAVEEAMRSYFSDTHNVAEGAGAIGLAALLAHKHAPGRRLATVLCGGNVDRAVFARVLTGKV